MKTIAAVLFLSVVMCGQVVTTYPATSGTVHPFPYISATLELGTDPYTEYAVVQYGSGFHKIVYSLPDGTSADLENVTYTAVTQNPNDVQMFTDVVTADDGTDSTAPTVTATATYTYRQFTRAGRGGGTYRIFVSGNLEVAR